MRNVCAEYHFFRINDIDNTKQLPQLINERLQHIGAQAINPAVDLANYLMFTYGQPFHVFDADKISGNIIVRYASDGESITTLAGDVIELDSSVLVIADSRSVLAIAGIIGSEAVAVDDNTRNVLIESAHFSAQCIAKTCRLFRLNSDSAYRFERGVDPAQAAQMGMMLVERITHHLGAR